jgi:hypothetical protein
MERWKRQQLHGPFDTLDACEAFRTEVARRVSAPGRKERIAEHSRKDREQILEAQRQVRDKAEHEPDPKQRREMLRMLPKSRPNDPRLCDMQPDDDWPDGHCVEEK